MNDQAFGKNLKKLRLNRGLTLRELGMRSGVHESTISRLENDPLRRPHIDTFVHLAQGFEISLQEFAILTEVIKLDEESILIEDDTITKNFHLLTKPNLLLLSELEGLNDDLRKQLVKFIAGMQKSFSGTVKS